MKLFYKEYANDRAELTLIILHGLLGSGRNWHTIATRLSERYRVIVPDMRNHGRSPHSETHRLADMVEDVYELQQDTGALPAVILGHSMGGLVAMEMAFRVPEALQGLIVVDIAPRPHRARVADVLEAMTGVRLHDLQTKKEVDEALAQAIASPVVRQFVLTNLMAAETGFQWRVNLPVLQRFLIESQSYRPAPTDMYEGPTLFIRGGKSGYIRDEDFSLLQHHFPRVRLETVPDAGHWVHYEAPDTLLRLVVEFLQEVQQEVG
ncbi:MAG: alpha/beta fold hydrolase [candidate division KSB1 bacterium]|nr:alpha/beta fold hydrolase [candidate division KSB1 bacterium]